MSLRGTQSGAHHVADPQLRRVRRGWGRVLTALFSTVVLALTGALLPHTAAQAVASGAISITSVTPATQGLGATFALNVSWSCSGVQGESCEDLTIEIPLELDNLPGALEEMNLWGLGVVLPSGSQAGFTHTVSRTGTSMRAVLRATRSIPAGTQESFLLQVTPHPTTGDGIGFLVGAAELSSPSFPSVASNQIRASLAVPGIPAPEKWYLGATPGAAGTMIATYEIRPNVQGVWDADTDTWSPCQYLVLPNNRNATVQADTLRIVDVLPAEATFLSASGGGIYDPIAHEVVWTSCADWAQLPYLVRVSLPAVGDSGDAGYLPSITNTVERSFTDTAGVAHEDDDQVTHSNLLVPRVPVLLNKCGQGRLDPRAGDVNPGGQCSPFRVAPAYGYTGDALSNFAVHYYQMVASRLQEGDDVTFTDWMPCLDAPIGVATPEAFASQVGCANPAEALHSLEFRRTATSGTSSPIGLQRLTLFLSDGTSEIYDGVIRPIPTLSPLPQFGTRSVIGFEAVTNSMTGTGQISVRAETRLLPGANRDMNLHNTVGVQVVNPESNFGFTGETTGIGVVRDGVGGVSSSSISSSASDRSVQGYFGVMGLDPVTALPSYTQVLPAGYEVRGGTSAGVTITTVSGATTTSNDYDIEILPEDPVTGTPARVVATPRPGTPAVPANVDSGWPYISMQVRLDRTWAPEFGSVSTRSFTSIDGPAARIERCMQYSPFVGDDPSDFDADGLRGGDSGCLAVASGAYQPTSLVAASVMTKHVRDAASSTWVGGNQIAATPSGAAEYLIQWENAGQPVLSDVVLYDILPFVGDTGALDGNGGSLRGSAFEPVFTGITSQSTSANVTVSYSAQTDPCRPEIKPSMAGCVGDWTTNPADLGGASEVRAIRVHLQGNWAGGSSFNLRFGVQLPANLPSGDIAWNTVAGRALLGGQPLVSAESARTGVRMPGAVIVEKASPQSAAPVLVGEPVEYVITAANQLDSRADDVRVVDDLTEMLQFASYSGDAVATIDGVSAGPVVFNPVTHELSWEGDLESAEVVEIRFTLVSTSSTTTAGAENGVVATVGPDPTNCTDGNETNCVVTVILVEPALSIAKTAVGVPEGSTLVGGATLTWLYTVTNVGSEPLVNLAVTDDQGVAVTCPVDRLPVGGSTVCEGSGSIGVGPEYVNVGSAAASGEFTGHPVTGSDPWSAQVAPSIVIDKFSTDVTEGSLLLAGIDVTWTYRVTNASAEQLTQLTVTDSRGVAVSCPATVLDPGESMECLGTGNVGTATPYTNTGVVTGRGAVTGLPALASDPWHVNLEMPVPGIAIVKDSAAVVEGSTVAAETSVTWRYTVSNTGQEPLTLVSVTDDRGVAVACPQDVLAVGESVACTGTGSVGFGPSYTNTGEVSGVGTVSAIPVSASDPWTVAVTPYRAGITLDKSAPEVTEGSWVRPGTIIEWEYLVTNTGEEPVAGLTVTDDQGVLVVCPAADLAPGASMVCEGSGPVGAGPEYRNIGEATGTTTLTGAPVSDTDPWQVTVREPVPGIGIVKGALNAVDGDRAPAAFVVDWQYTVVNTGEEPIEHLEVVDDQGIIVTCPVARLAVGASTVCTGSGSIGVGTAYANVATASGAGGLTGLPVEAEDTWSIEVEVPDAAVTIVKDAVDHEAGDPVTVGSSLTWIYTVVNTGGQPLGDLVVVDDQGVSVTCPATTLAVAASMECTGTGPVGSGTFYRNLGTVTGVGAWSGTPVADEDPWSTPLQQPAPAGSPLPPVIESIPVAALPVTGASATTPLVGLAALLLLASGVVALGLRYRSQVHRAQRPRHPQGR